MNKKENSIQREILQIEHGTFTPLIFLIYGSTGRECRVRSILVEVSLALLKRFPNNVQ